MRILTVDNLAYDLNKLPETVSDDMAFSVLDNSNPKEPDFFFIPLIYIESFSAPAIVLEIGGREITEKTFSVAYEMLEQARIAAG